MKEAPATKPRWRIAYDEYWFGLTRKGDPLHIPNPFSKSFEAGWNAASAPLLQERVEALEKALRTIKKEFALAFHRVMWPHVSEEVKDHVTAVLAEAERVLQEKP